MRPAFSGWPVLARSQYRPLAVPDGTPRAAMSARLITGRPFIAGTGIYLLAQPYAQTARQAASGLGAPQADAGILALTAAT